MQQRVGKTPKPPFPPDWDHEQRAPAGLPKIQN